MSGIETYTNRSPGCKPHTTRAYRQLSQAPLPKPLPPLLPSPRLIPPLRRIISRPGLRLPLQYLRMLMHTRHQPHANRPADRPRHLPLIDVPEARLARMPDPSHLGAKLPHHGEILHPTRKKNNKSACIPPSPQHQRPKRTLYSASGSTANTSSTSPHTLPLPPPTIPLLPFHFSISALLRSCGA